MGAKAQGTEETLPPLPPAPPASSIASRNVMRANRRVDTKPELALRRRLHAEGLRFRKDYLVRAGGQRTHADVAFTRQRVAIFIDGCFWHSCPEHGRTPRRNSKYWEAKLSRNVIHDRLLTAALEADGWRVLRI